MNRKRLIVGAVILAIFVIVILIGVGFLLSRLKDQPQAHNRSLVTELVYCNASNLKPCIVSFSLDADGNMLINLLIPDAAYPYFYLTISRENIVNEYECQLVEDFPTNIYCIGPEMYPGETLQFTLLTLKNNTVLAEGKFSIIGLLLPNPEGELTATLSGTSIAGSSGEPTETPTPISLEILTPISTGRSSATPTPTKTGTSYPNPSYPYP